MPSRYRQTEAYKWYLNEREKERRPGLPPYETNEQGEYLVRPGEFYCRVEIDDNYLCHHTSKFSTPSALKKHLEIAHGATYVGASAGSLSAVDDQQAVLFYRRLQGLAFGHDVELRTPKKQPQVRRTTNKPRTPKKADGSVDMDKLGTLVADFKDQKCAFCRERKLECPAPERNDRCMVWRQFAPDEVSFVTASK
ncbi:hypothetical protein E4U54_001650, partial [Claviceps lovelessii]